MSKLYPSPVLGYEKKDYLNDVELEVNYQKTSATQFEINFCLTGNNYIAQLIKKEQEDSVGDDEKICFFTTVVFQRVLYRKTVTEANFTINNNKIETKIKMDVPSTQNNIFMNSGIVNSNTSKILTHQNYQDSGLDPFYYKEENSKPIEFLPYCLLADDGWVSSWDIGHLFRLRLDDQLPETQIMTELNWPHNFLHFDIFLHPNLKRLYFQNKQIKNQILSVAFTQGLQEIKSKYISTDEQDESDLLDLTNHLRTWLIDNKYLTWEDGDDFNPALTASKFTPILADE